MNASSQKYGIIGLVVTSAAFITWVTCRINLVVDEDVAEQGRPRFKYPEGGIGMVAEFGNMFDTSLVDNFCNPSENLTAVIPIYSDPDRSNVRAILRNTLAKQSKTLNCKVLFIVGVSLNPAVNTLLRTEYYKENDILFMPRVDTYLDRNDKAVLMLQWINKHCSNVPYVIHATDDTYINIEKFLKHLASVQEKYFILGVKQESYIIPRNHLSKNFLTWDEYPNKRFPPHLNGHAYAFPTRLAERLLSAVHTANHCWMEEVWLTGHVRQRAGVKLKGLVYKEDWITGVTLAEHPELYNKLTSFTIVYELYPEMFYSLY